MMKKRSGLQKKKKTSSRIWEIVEDVKNTKSDTILDDPRYEKDFNPFLLIRALSMDTDLIEFANFANIFQGVLDKKQMYKLLIKLIPKTNKRVSWIKNKMEDNKKLDKIMEYFDCNRREASLYVDILGDKWATEIESYFGGLKKTGE